MGSCACCRLCWRSSRALRPAVSEIQKLIYECFRPATPRCALAPYATQMKLTAGNCSSRSMRALTGILFLLGCSWALMAWFLIPTPLGIFEPRYQYGAHDVVSSLLASAMAIAGYFIWFGWAWFTFRGRFPLVGWRHFWLISLFQHCAWLIVFPSCIRGENVIDFLGSQELMAVKIWCAINAVIATFCVLALREH